MTAPSGWLVVVALFVAAIVADRPCSDCGRWMLHTLICRRRAH